MSRSPPADAAEPLLEFDRKARDLFAPHRDTPVVKALAWLSEVGDQPQMRLVCGGMIAAGALRRDGRMFGAGLRMLLAHELATALKDVVKHRVDRSRPRSASSAEDQKPRPGHNTSKEKTSFPSGHSAGSMAVALAYSAAYPEHRAPATLAAGAVALAQIPRCAHYPSDVAAGLAIGTAAEAAVGWVWRRLVG